MEGLDKLRESVLNRARAEAEEILQQARAEAGRITEQSQEEIARREEETAAENEERLRSALTRSGSLVELDKRRILLEARQEVVSETLDRTLEALADLDPDKKAAFYIRLLRDKAKDGQEVRFAARDADIAERVLSEVQADLKRGPDEPGSGGITLREGRVTWRYTFEELISSSRDELVSLAAGILFGQENRKDT